MNATTQAIIAQLPKKPILVPAEIAAAYGLAGTTAIIADIKTGKLAANIINGRFLISRDAAIDYITKNEYEPEEGTI
ncbi:MAG: hypothetical protein IJQ00_05895 [Kiritimatiellae bacterium]|nr:hypothetical protein [Kiritimatiellia bacterium]